LCVAPANVRAGSGEVVRLPANVRAPNRTGLLVTIDTTWVDASGYRNVRIHLATSNTLPSPGDRQLRVEISPSTWGNRDHGQTTRGWATLDQGAVSSVTHLLVPQSKPWNQVQLDVYEGGRLLRPLSTEFSINNNASSSDEWSEAVATVLVIDADAPSTFDRAAALERYNRNASRFTPAFNCTDIRGLANLTNRSAFSTQGSSAPPDMQLLAEVARSSRLEMLPPDSLPDNWLGYTCFDLLVVSRPDLQDLSANHRSRFEAILHWVNAGGNLFVYDAGPSFEHLDAIEKLCRIKSVGTDPDRPLDGWSAAGRGAFNDRAVRNFQNMERYRGWYNEGEEKTEPEPPAAPFAEAFGGGAGPRLLSRRCGMGMVCAVEPANPFPGNTTEWSWVLNSLSEGRAMWYRRHGVSLRRANDDYWEFLVPDTGKAPVFAFCVLITLFGVAIGPVNYFVLQRQKRLYFLLLTIPLGAALMTFGLVFYVVVSDGLHTQVRVRSYTHLDQRNGQAQSWSRQSYYAGLTPSRGLIFPTDAAVYPVEPTPRNEYDGRGGRHRTIVWEDEQTLESGYMVSRVTSQFLVIRSAESSAALQFDKPAGPSTVTNRLGAPVDMLLVCDHDHVLYWAEDIAVGGKVKLAKADPARDLPKLTLAIAQNRPTEPPGFDRNAVRSQWGRRWYGWNSIDNGMPDAIASTSLMEIRMREIQNSRRGVMVPGTYVALLASQPESPLGVAGAVERAGFHLVEGEF
ncbi:MAG: hypothetical protein KDA41_11285, partial [Planctomycetales bacterium]|nr:hypothetical protein [Planctomycetales bacterium]